MPDARSNGDEALRNAFFAVDVIVNGLPEFFALISILPECAAEDEGLFLHTVEEVKDRVEGLAVAVGIIRSSLADLRLIIPEAQA